ncbi:MAG: DUF1736 domain-containing protein [bacterium]|nr:DUF1736 domain-containing protein [bacterium]
MKQFKLVFLFSVALSFLIFGNGISGEFVFDDTTVVQNRPDIKDAGNFFNLFISPYHQNTPKSGLYRPFTMATYSLNHNIFGSSPVSFHIVNIVIHALNSFLVFWLVIWLLKSRPVAYVSSLLFLFHPVHTEAVTSIVGRAELLAFFWSLTVIYLLSKNKKILAAGAFLFGLMSKEVALMVLPLIFYIDIFFLNKSWRRAVTNNLFLVFPFALYLFLRYLALGRYFAGDVTTTIVSNVLIFVSWPERIFTALKVLFLYVAKLFWPVHLSADYSYNAIPVVKNMFTSLPSIAGLIVLAGLVVALISHKIRRTGFGLAAATFFFPYLMISNLVIPVGTIMGERLMYFPSLGFVLLLAWLLERFFRSPRFDLFKDSRSNLIVFCVVFSTILVFFGARTVIRNKDWHDAKTLFSATVKESSNSLITRTALAGVHIRANEWDLAKEQLEIARRIYENSSHLQNLFGIVADHEENYVLAEEKYKRSLELNPNAVDSSINLAELYLKEGRLEESGENFLKVINFYATTEYVVRYSYIQIALNKPDIALDMVYKYFGFNLNHSEITAVTGTAYFVNKDYKQALIYLKKARELGNKAPEIGEMIQISEGNL